jgi:hypothetical protein
MRTNEQNELQIRLWLFTVSAKGMTAVRLIAIPVTLLLCALALRIAGFPFGY